MTATPLLKPQTAILEAVTRHPLNFYESPSWFTTELLRHVPLSGVIGEPCVGHGAIATLLSAWPYTKQMWTNDIDPHKAADYQMDATLSDSWAKFPDCDWICTNPPYAEFAAPIINNAYQKARVGVAAFLLTSFLEPCDDRADFLQQHPPSLIIIMPRFCFRKDKRGTRWATDNITILCLVWDKRATGQQIIIRPKSAIAGFYKNPEQAITQEQLYGRCLRRQATPKENYATANFISRICFYFTSCLLSRVSEQGRS